MDSISRISSVLETARELTLEAAQTAGSVRARGMGGTSSNRALPPAQLKKLLDSRNDRDVLEGLRRVISITYRAQPSLPYFSSVIKNVASPSLEIKKLVYIYLLHHAEAEPDLALLSINTIQKSLADQNPQVRALALKVMSGIRVPVISQIVSLAIKKGAGDMSPLVRRAAALAIPKCYRLDPATLPQLLEHLSLLLGDRQYFVVGAAVMAFMDVCPDRLDLIHRHYRELLRKLVDMDEWGQLATLRLMVIYARRCFPLRTAPPGSVEAGDKEFYNNEHDKGQAGEVTAEGEAKGENVRILDPDLERLLKACRPLLQSRNSAVIVAVARCYVHLATPAYITEAVGPLIALLRSAQDIQLIALHNIVSVCLLSPQPFVRYATHFLVRSDDPPDVWRLKLEVLTIIFPHCALLQRGVILAELEHFSRVADQELVRASVRAIGRCAQSDPRTSARCLRLLLKQITSPDGNLVAESLTVIRHMIQQDPQAHRGTVVQLAKNLDVLTNPRARASIIWLVGEFAGAQEGNNIAPDVLRILVKGFADESEAAKLQIVLLAAKVYVHHLNRINKIEKVDKLSPSFKEAQEVQPTDIGGANLVSKDEQGVQDAATDEEHPIALLWAHILLLARYDTSYDLRDRARLYKALLAVPSSTQLATLLLLAPKPVPQTPSPSESRKAFTIGSASLVIGEEGGLQGVRGYDHLPAWVEAGKEPDPRLRDDVTAKAESGDRRGISASEMLDKAVKGGVKAVAGQSNKARPNGEGITAKDKTLDDWLAESESERKSDDDEEEDEEEEGEDEDEDEDEEDSEETSEEETTDDDSD